MRTKIRAFTALELLVVVAAVLILAALALPSLSGSHKSVRVECANNLKQIGLAFRLWSGDCGDKYPMQELANESIWSFHLNATNEFRYFQVMSNELTTPKNLVCPADTKRKPAANFTNGFDNSHISYFVGLDADETMPLTFLAGDRNLTNGQPKTNNILCLQTNQLVGWTKDLHNLGGNIAMADGSVRQLNTGGLQKALGDTGLATNRLLFP
jgi:prepilin-type processing-associated H-X9-DG protein